MERVGSHVIDIRSGADASSSGSLNDSNVLDRQLQADRPSTIVTSAASQPAGSSSNESNSRISSSARRGNAHNRRRRRPLNSTLWISVELVLTIGQITAAIVVLSLSRHEHSRAPLFSWIVGYAFGCMATLPLLYRRYRHRNPATDQDSSQARQNSPTNNPPIVTTFSSISTTRISELEDRSSTITTNRGTSRLKAFMEYYKTAVDCFFAVWFVVGNVWIFGGHSSPSEAPNMYRLCLVFLAFSCIGYAMPFIICVTICCCLPCAISILGFREDSTQNRGATSESINSLPTYKFKVKKGKNSSGREINLSVAEGGVIAAGTDKERAITGEDAVCCICLAKYGHNDELRELGCNHLFHKECVDKWLKMNALCPLCKAEVGETVLDAVVAVTASLRN
ncbi:E3 ubiquitin-protein ligase At1g12760 [Impatiens glandulifera]|uniref:E3 ubiquitin-protein ligase At1g12760 n=1 Tax=Impatiens glandulifera TaxID=253017 RepID=UPI001FB0EFD7|nr:E3 ubiquitin-protein ligase At1g12760 [Impatiens glandulifera]